MSSSIRALPRSAATTMTASVDSDDSVLTLAPPVLARPGLEELYLWDPWPVLTKDGQVADVHGQEWWIALTAPRALHPEARHDHARLRLLRRSAAGWDDLGNLLSDGASPGSREWSGTTVFDPADASLHLLYTATGIRGEPRPTFIQRIFQSRAYVRAGHVAGWTSHTEVVQPDEPYLPADEQESAAGACRAFRDPFFFQDPHDDCEYLVFAASVRDSTQTHARAVGLAVRDRAGWKVRRPLLQATGVNRELERPHLLCQDGRYYLFVSTHGQSFHPRVEDRTGLYGFWAENVLGPYLPLNHSGLVLANTDDAPYANYAWQVLSDGRVVSFVNYPTAGPGPLKKDCAFAGTIAPFARLRLDGTSATLQRDAAQPKTHSGPVPR